MSASRSQPPSIPEVAPAEEVVAVPAKVVYEVVSQVELQEANPPLVVIPDEPYTLNQQPAAYGLQFKSENSSGDALEFDIGVNAYDKRGRLVGAIDMENSELFDGLIKPTKVAVPRPPSVPRANAEDDDEPDEVPLEEVSVVSVELENIPEEVVVLYFTASSVEDSPAAGASQLMSDARDSSLAVMQVNDIKQVLVQYELNPHLRQLEVVKAERIIKEREEALAAAAAAEAAAKAEAEKSKLKRTKSKKGLKDNKKDKTKAAKEKAEKEAQAKAEKEAKESETGSDNTSQEGGAQETVSEPEFVLPTLTSVIWARLARNILRPNVWTLTSIKSISTAVSGEDLTQEVTSLAKTYTLERKALKKTPLTSIRMTRLEDLCPFGDVMGRCLDLRESTTLTCGLGLIQQRDNLELSLWGKIYGVKTDYIIVRAINLDPELTREYYYSIDNGKTLHRLPLLDAWAKERAPLIEGYFTGKPNTRSRDPRIPLTEDEKEALDAADDDDVEEEEEPEPGAPRQLLEIERLAYRVQQIDENTCVVPKGAYVLDALTLDRVTTNTSFQGLNLNSVSLNDFCYLRTPQKDETRRALARSSLEDRTDALDTLAEGNFRGLWGIVKSRDGDVVTLRSLLHPGYEFRHELGTQKYHGAYFGYAQVQLGVAHMLP